jgi:hypothetical protein
MIRDLSFLPNAKGQLARCHTMYDPEVEELAKLVGHEHFPHAVSRTHLLMNALELAVLETEGRSTSHAR